MFPGTKSILPPYLMLHSFIIMQAYAGMSTNSEASSRAEWSTPLSIFILITGLGKEYVTFVKGFEARRASLQQWPWICKALIFSFSVDLYFKFKTENGLETLCLTGRSLDWATNSWGLQEYLTVLPCFNICHNLLDEHFCFVTWSLRCFVEMKLNTESLAY